MKLRKTQEEEEYPTKKGQNMLNTPETSLGLEKAVDRFRTCKHKIWHILDSSKEVSQPCQPIFRVL